MSEKKIFSGFGIDIIKRDGVYFIEYDGGEIAGQIIRNAISKEDALRAQRSSDDAYKVILEAQNRESR